MLKKEFAVFWSFWFASAIRSIFPRRSFYRAICSF